MSHFRVKSKRRPRRSAAATGEGEWIVAIFAENGSLFGRFQVETMSQAAGLLDHAALVQFPDKRFLARIELAEGGEGWWTCVGGSGGSGPDWIPGALARVHAHKLEIHGGGDA